MNRQINFRASGHEAVTLAEVAGRSGCSKSDVLRKGIAVVDLQSLKAERAKIQSRLVEIEASRGKLGSFDDEIERCKNALQAFANAAEFRVDQWCGAGCVGHRPEPEFGKHAELEQKLHRALLGADNARTALNTLDIREEAAHKELARVSMRLKEAAARQIQFELREQGEAILAFRAQLATLEASQLGAHDFMQNFDQAVYEQAKVRNPVFGFWRTMTGLPDVPHGMFQAAEVSDVMVWASRFDALMAGD